MKHSNRVQCLQPCRAVLAVAGMFVACGGGGGGGQPAGPAPVKPNAAGSWIVASCRRVRSLEVASELSFTVDCGDTLVFGPSSNPTVVLLRRIDAVTRAARCLEQPCIQTEIGSQLSFYVNQTSDRTADYAFGGSLGALQFDYELHLTVDPPVRGLATTM